ncbi:hypothetical protein Sjap_005368 [Stephania japonica]|uniref:Uncharacterized protein n=1 Tax=Stephania japonica TaxID=461633 RepID=A0AAP0PL31_9MAGN
MQEASKFEEVQKVEVQGDVKTPLTKVRNEDKHLEKQERKKEWKAKQSKEGFFVEAMKDINIKVSFKFASSAVQNYFQQLFSTSDVDTSAVIDNVPSYRDVCAPNEGI